MNLIREDKRLQEQRDDAWQLFVSGRWDEALRLFQSVLALEPDCAMAASVAGGCLLRLGHFEEAVAYARTGVARAPGIALAHLFLAEALFAKEQYPEAEAEYWEAVAVNQSALAPQIELGRFLLSRDRHHEARERLEKAIAISPNDSDAHYLMAICNVRDQKIEEALNEIEQATRFAPASDVVWHFRGLVVMGRAKSFKKKRERVAVFRDAAESLRNAVELNPNNVEAKQHLRLSFEAIAAFDQYLDSVDELKKSWWQIALFVAGLVIFAILDRSFWINALLVVAAVSVLAIWRNRRAFAGLGPDPFDSIHPLQLEAAGSNLCAISTIEPVNEWLN